MNKIILINDCKIMLLFDRLAIYYGTCPINIKKKKVDTSISIL